jgi:hypothetical protein
MRGTITDNLGGSQYNVDVDVGTACLVLELRDARAALDDAAEILAAAQQEKWRLQAEYADLLMPVYVAQEGYETCRLEFDLTAWKVARRIELGDIRYDCRAACEDAI